MSTGALSGIVADLDEVEYHANPALSSSNARLILESPARLKHRMDNPQPFKKSFDVGTAAHKKVLGVGAEIAVIPDEFLASNGAISTTKAKEFVAQARESGLTPIKSEVAAEVDAMSEAILAHSTARYLIEQQGISEASVFGKDPQTGVDLRARFDRLPDLTLDDPIAVDLKSTARTASKQDFERIVWDHGYFVQEAHYEDVLEIVTGRRVPFLFVVVETQPPHLVAVHQLDVVFRRMGSERAKRAREMFAECTESGIWPGYPTEVQLVSPPVWALYQHEEQYS